MEEGTSRLRIELGSSPNEQRLDRWQKGRGKAGRKTALVDAMLTHLLPTILEDEGAPDDEIRKAAMVSAIQLVAYARKMAVHYNLNMGDIGLVTVQTYIPNEPDSKPSQPPAPQPEERAVLLDDLIMDGEEGF